MCNHVIWVYFKVLKMTLRLTFAWNAPKVSKDVERTKNFITAVW